MACVVHFKTNSIIIVLVTIFCIKIEDIYCGDSNNDIMNGYSKKVIKDDVQVCVSQIFNDLNGCTTSLQCITFAFIYLNYKNLQKFSQKYVKYLYGGIGKDHIVSPFTYCDLKIENEFSGTEKVRRLNACREQMDEYKLGNMRSSGAVGFIYFSKEIINIPINTQAWLYSTYVISRVDYKAVEQNMVTPDQFCAASCLGQINVAYNYCQDAPACARFALEFLVFDDLMGYAQDYFVYLFGKMQTTGVKTVLEFCNNMAGPGKTEEVGMFKTDYSYGLYGRPSRHPTAQECRKELLNADIDCLYSLSCVQAMFYSFSSTKAVKGGYAWQYFQYLNSQDTIFSELINDGEDPIQFCQTLEG